MIGASVFYLGAILILAVVATGLFLRVVVLHSQVHRLRRAIAKLEGTTDNNPDDAEEDQLGTGDSN